MKEILLTRGKIAIVDDEDFTSLSRYKWRAHKDRKRNIWYAVRSVYFPVQPSRSWENDTIRMHCQILQWFEGIDHINHDGLDNRRSNLRIATATQNAQNSRKRKGTSSKYKGVYWDKQMSSYRARITVEGKHEHLGLFKDEEAAARAYDAAATIYFGERSLLNFPP